MNPDGSDRKTIVTNCHLLDGIVVDAEAGHIYWTNMGVPNLDDGSIERADLDGENRRIIVPQGVTHTPRGRPVSSAQCLCREARANPSGWRVESTVP